MKNAPIFADNSEAAQCSRLLDILKMRPVGCREARKAYAISDPVARVKELRKRGHRIVTIWRWRQFDCGIYIRSGQFVLVGEHYDHQ